MFRFTLLPLLIITSTLLLGLISFFIYRKIKKIVSSAYKKSAELAAEKQQQWKNNETRKQFPTMLQKGFETYDSITQTTAILSEEWSTQLIPLNSQAKQILDELAFNVESIKTNENKNTEAKKNDVINSMRTFFIHTLDALQQFVEKIEQDSNHMSADQASKAKENINVLAADLAHHQKILDKKRKFDFDVLMDVIKARLKT